ncbi:MAG: substrate-binding domain-containing protein [Pseudomonadota bacterium]
MLPRFRHIAWLFTLCLPALLPAASHAAAEAGASDMTSAVAKASARGAPWSGPVTGPAAQPGATVAIISEDLRNGGILGVVKGAKEATATIGWRSKVYDAGGSPAGRAKALADALASGPQGLILIGVDAKAAQPQLAGFAAKTIPVVGWHVSAFAGPVAGSAVAMNVSSNPLDVARVTAMAAVAKSGGKAGVVIFTDSNFEIATAKSNVMADVIRACAGCKLLEVRDVAISRSAEQMAGVTRELLARHGKAWTHALAINDIYFDYAAQELTKAGRASNSLEMLSAGDGSAAAFLRIQAGTFQSGTVAEPLNLHGWQLVDEMNRLFARQPVSGYVVPVHLVTPENIAFDGGAQRQYDPDNGYRAAYKRIWKR